MIAAELDRLNRERQAVEQATLAQAHAEALAALGLEEKGATIVTAAEGWHPGVVGLVAARLKERFGRPAFAIALGPGETGTGSGRSIAGVDLGRAVRHALAGGLLLKGGGHAMAAGVTLKTSALQAFRAFLEETLAPGVEAARREDALRIDAAITAAAATTELCATLARAGPFGAGNPEPVLALPSHTLAHAEVIGQAHVRARLRSGDGHSLQAIAFRAAGQKLGEALLQHRGQPVHVAGSLSVDRWQGGARAAAHIGCRARRSGGAHAGVTCRPHP
jgi:single-stranded-DNA-specific exonuclease